MGGWHDRAAAHAIVRKTRIRSRQCALRDTVLMLASLCVPPFFSGLPGRYARSVSSGLLPRVDGCTPQRATCNAALRQRGVEGASTWRRVGGRPDGRITLFLITTTRWACRRAYMCVCVCVYDPPKISRPMRVATRASVPIRRSGRWRSREASTSDVSGGKHVSRMLNALGATRVRRTYCG